MADELNAAFAPRILHVLLRLRSDTAENDAEIVEALHDVKWFTHVILVVPSWQEKPDALSNPLVQKALSICSSNYLRVIWGRWLWVAWPTNQDNLPNSLSHLDPAYYATAITRVKNEASTIGAVATFLDAEPYGKSEQKTSIKTKELTEIERVGIQDAVWTATRAAGRVDLLYPTSSMRMSHYAWAILRLGIYNCDSKTYYTKTKPQIEAGTILWNWPNVNPPSNVTHIVHMFGSNVGLGRPEDVLNTQVLLTSTDMKNLDLAIIRQKYPECIGLWAWVGNEILPQVIRSF